MSPDMARFGVLATLLSYDSTVSRRSEDMLWSSSPHYSKANLLLDVDASIFACHVGQRQQNLRQPDELGVNLNFVDRNLACVGQ